MSASACSIPVFRYALDRWPADAYRLEVSPAAAKDESIARFLRNHGANSPLNLEVLRLPANAAGASSRLLFPHAAEKASPPVWSGVLDAATLTQLTNSPVRRELVRRLLAGEAAVWLLVESGNREADEAAAAKLAARLTFLESAATLPSIDPNDPTSKLGPGPALRVKFSMLRVRAAPSSLSLPRGEGQGEGWNVSDESALLKMIGGPKGVASASEPLLAPVFGRGRVLGAWTAKEMGSEQIDEACLFLLGACSCEVKRQNPGWDLLLAVDWDAELQAIGFPTGESSAVKPNVTAAPETVTIRGGGDAIAAPPSQPANWLPGGVALVLLVAGALAWHNFARRP